LLLKEKEKMEKLMDEIQQLQSQQIHNLKFRIEQLESNFLKDIETTTKMDEIRGDRCINWSLELRKSINKLWFMFFLLACSMILHSVAHIMKVV